MKKSGLTDLARQAPFAGRAIYFGKRLTGAKLASAFFLEKTKLATGLREGVCVLVSPKKMKKPHAATSITRRVEVIEFFVCVLNSLVGGGGPSVGRGTNLLKDYAEIENFNAKNCFLLGK